MTITYADDRGAPLAAGARVVSTGTDDGSPLWAIRGTVVGFGRTRIRVQWDGFGYDTAFPFHAVPSAAPDATGARRATVLRVQP